MKKATKNAIVVMLVMLVWSCNPKKVDSDTITDSVVNEEVKLVKNSIAVGNTKLETKDVEGKVLEIQNGKDGYTAKIEAKDNEVYYVTISHSNLRNHEQYKTFKVGEYLNVTGDFWKMEDENQITVRIIN